MAEITKKELVNLNEKEAEEFMKELKILFHNIVKNSHDAGFIEGSFFAFVPYAVTTFLLYVLFGDGLFDSDNLLKTGLVILLTSWALAFFMRACMYYVLYKIQKIPDKFLTEGE